MYIDFKPSKIIKLVNSNEFIQFTAIAEKFNNKEDEELGNTFIAKNNIILDYTKKIDQPIFVKCWMIKDTEISSMNFKNYEINSLDKDNPYINEEEEEIPSRVNHDYIVSNIVKGHPTRIKGYVIRTSENECERLLYKDIPMIEIDIISVDFFKRDESLEDFSRQELIARFGKIQREYLTKEENAEFDEKNKDLN